LSRDPWPTSYRARSVQSSSTRAYAPANAMIGMSSPIGAPRSPVASRPHSDLGC
jgi:hypothetical protein